MKKINLIDTAGNLILAAAVAAILLNFFFNGNGIWIANFLTR